MDEGKNKNHKKKIKHNHFCLLKLQNQVKLITRDEFSLCKKKHLRKHIAEFHSSGEVIYFS